MIEEKYGIRIRESYDISYEDLIGSGARGRIFSVGGGAAVKVLYDCFSGELGEGDYFEEALFSEFKNGRFVSYLGVKTPGFYGICKVNFEGKSYFGISMEKINGVGLHQLENMFYRDEISYEIFDYAFSLREQEIGRLYDLGIKGFDVTLGNTIWDFDKRDIFMIDWDRIELSDRRREEYSRFTV